jgi:uncharacterized membrane protein
LTENKERPSKAGDRLARLRRILRLIAAMFFIGGGANHFRNPRFYERIIPPNFSSPHALVLISGVAEIVGGLGLLVRPLRRTVG